VENEVSDFIVTFVGILYEAMPFIVLGAVLAGIVEEFIPQRWVLAAIPRNRILAIATGCWLGLLFPMCECGILVILRRLLRKGVPLSAGVAYMLAGPIINVVVMGSTYFAFLNADAAGPQSPNAPAHIGALGMMSLRIGLGFLVAFGTGLIVEWQHRKHGNRLLASPDLAPAAEPKELAGEGTPTRSFPERISAAAETALHDFVDVMVFLILGALLASAARVGLPRSEVEHFSQNYPLGAIGAMMALAILLCLCSEADAFVAASFQAVGPSAKLAFLVLGPMLDLKLYMMYRSVFSTRLIWTIITSVVVQVAVYSLVVHFLWTTYGR
jgi:uncharacterized membrane protein YraQ (UPF0718 family)